MKIHLIMDLIAYASAFGVRRYFPPHPQSQGYYVALVVGVVIGAFGFGTLGIAFVGIGRSILGALVGGIIAVEIYKALTHQHGSSGAYWVPSLALGIAIGRIGCFASGLEDYTYGIPTTLPWGVDFGDHLVRHPVQLYESGLMGLFFLYALWRYRVDRRGFEAHIFYQFVGFYALERFALEFLKPYPSVAWGLNVFQYLSMALMIYAIIYYRRAQRCDIFS